MHRLCTEINKSNVFGFLDPTKLSFNSKSAKTREVQTYIQTRLRDMNKVCYLAPFLMS